MSTLDLMMHNGATVKKWLESANHNTHYASTEIQEALDGKQRDLSYIIARVGLTLDELQQIEKGLNTHLASKVQ